MKARELSPKLLSRLDKERGIVNHYKARNVDGSRRYLTRQIAKFYGVNPATVWRIAKRWGVAQTHAEANAAISHLKRRSRLRHVKG
jgi:hypothetical protein